MSEVPARNHDPGHRWQITKGHEYLSSVRVLFRVLIAVGLSATLLAPVSGARAQPSVTDLTRQINKASAQLEKVVESYNRLNEQIKESRAAIATITARIGPIEEQVRQGRAEVGTLAARAYKSGGLREVNALLRTDGRNSLADRLGTLDLLARDRQRQLRGYDATQRRYVEEKARLDATLARQTAQRKQLAIGKSRIEADLDKLYEMRRAAYGRATSAGSSYSGKIPPVSGQAGVAVRYAYGAIGKPYVWAADGPAGYDCSGLTLAAWRAAGKNLPHNAAMQWDRVAHLSRGSLRPGDLVFYRGLGHVALYVGGGKVIHAPTFGETVKIASVDMMTPYGYGRVR